ncbi:hypothetical protein AUR04nite_34360 [Glutamicibacter uratoxydans]|uniref:Uncharacterized protein n=1 Tax=Glutamicibacter uratoxydans TaxID=43667 RepID=A0A4Y4DVN6_GLUUR|nr:hypothetical protein [Glutamicibacter uratoxydans]GED07904.1 hypothetical protein AUR04nite_34360 [Glutamicibacter uratoxydans]
MTAKILVLRPETFAPGQVFSRPGLATYLRLRPRTLANWSARGTGRDLHYAIEDVATWLAGTKTGTKLQGGKRLRVQNG